MPRLPEAGVQLVARGAATFYKNMEQAERAQQGLTESAKDASNRMETLGRSMAYAGGMLTALGAGLLNTTRHILDYRSSVSTLQLAQDNLAAAFDTTQGALRDEVNELIEMYVPVQRANEIVNRLTMSHMEFARSSELVASAQDLAVSAGLELNKMYDSMLGYIVTGRKQILRNTGIVANASQIYAWWARQIGKTGDELTAIEEAQARFNFLIRYGERARGSFQEFLETVPGQLVKARTQVTELANSLGRHLAPMIIEILKWGNGILEQLNALPESTKRVIARALGLGGAFAAVSGSLLLTLAALTRFVPIVTKIPKLLGTLTKGSSAAAGVLGGLKAAIASIGPAGWAAIGVVAALGAAIKSNFGGLGDLYQRTAGQFFGSLWKALRKSVPWVRASLSLVLDGIREFARLALTPFRNLSENIKEITSSLARDGWGFEFDPERFFTGAASIMGKFASGILWGFTTFVLPTVIFIVESIAAFLGRSMPTKGPLTDVDLGGISIIRAWLEGMSSVSLSKVREIAEHVEGQLQDALWGVRDAIYSLREEEFALDRALWPFEKRLRIVRAEAQQILIPLEQQIRKLEDQREVLEDVAEKERERAERYLRQLEKQQEKLQEIIDIDQERIDVLDWEIFIEERRNTLLDRSTSARLLQMESQKRALEDEVAINEERQEVIEDEIETEEDRLEQITTAAEKQIEALEEQIAAINGSVEVQEERIRLAREALELEEARQAQARLSLDEELTYWRHERDRINYFLGVLRRLPSDAKEASEALEEMFPETSFEEMEESVKEVSNSIDEMKEKMLAAFKKEVGPQLEKLEKQLDRLGNAWERLFPEGGFLAKQIKNIKILTGWIGRGAEAISKWRIWEDIGTIAVRAWGDIETAARETWNWIEPRSVRGWENIRLAAEKTYTWIERNAPMAFAPLKSAFTLVLDGFKRGFTTMKNTWDTLVEAVKDFWTWLTGREFKVKIDLPMLPTWATPGSALPIHTAWEKFAQDMERMVVRPQVDVSAMADLSTIVDAPGAGASSTVIHRTEHITNQGPQLNLAAHYAREQSEGAIKDDIGMMLALA
ncbi:hypothetical protein GF373_17715 [bacterium]|nr:hypothetical protein [bacterium]